GRPAGPGEAPLVDGQLGATRVDRRLQPLDRQVGELLADRLQPLADVVELPGHAPPPRRSSRRCPAWQRLGPRPGTPPPPVVRECGRGCPGRPPTPTSSSPSTRRTTTAPTRSTSPSSPAPGAASTGRGARACSPGPHPSSSAGAAATAPTSSTRTTPTPPSRPRTGSPTSSGSSGGSPPAGVGRSGGRATAR